MPVDFDTNRDVHYAAIRQPGDASAFIADLQARLHAGLDRLDHAVRTNTAGGVRITSRRGRPWIVVPAMGSLPDPPNIQALHREIQHRYGMLDLLDVLKDADHLSDFTTQLTSVASREITGPETARRRKLLVSFGLGSTSGSGGLPRRLTGTLPTRRPRYAGSAGCTSTATGCAARSSRSSTRRSRFAT